MQVIISLLKRTLPTFLFHFLQLPYHYGWALFGALLYRFPSRRIKVVAVTGTKGKSSVVELVSALLEEGGFKTALASTIHFKIGEKVERNLHKMTMPGRFFLQNFLRKAVNAKCEWAVIEMTSEGARQFRHKFIDLDALIFTNLAPEHIESHGSYEKYVAAKVSLAEALEESPLKKPARRSAGGGALASSQGGLLQPRKATPFGKEKTTPASADGGTPFIKGDKVLIVNGDDKESHRFMEAFSGKKVSFSKRDAKNQVVSSEGVSFEWLKPSPIGEGSPEHSAWQNVLGGRIRIISNLPGEFNLYNILAAVSFAQAIGISLEKIKAGIEKVKSIRGRAERISLEVGSSDSLRSDLKSGKRSDLGGIFPDFTVIVDYAHTPDSLEKFYQTYAGKYRICVLGNTGGGRDTWKRPVMAGIAEKYCDEVILTNEDPYDEDPEKILREMTAGMNNNPRLADSASPLLRGKQPTIILDRRAAIRHALQKASKGDVVLITGKGTDPFIMGPRGEKMPWDDATVVREELGKLVGSSF